MKIQKINKKNISECVELMKELWPHDSYSKLINSINKSTHSVNNLFVILTNDRNEYIAFAEFSIRNDYVEGSKKTPVGYLEGIYVRKKYRKQGISRILLKYGENWAKMKGCHEFASDTELRNKLSQKVHKKLGFIAANKIVCFIKKI
jgi:aminoglycoside 6'-N-acetyltransferase I